VAFNPAALHQPLFLLTDGPHAGKKARNSLEKSFNAKQVRKADGGHLREIMVPAGPNGELIEVSWQDVSTLLDWDLRQAPRLTRLSKAHAVLNEWSRMRCHLATEVFQAAILYDEAKTKPADQPLTGLVWYSRLWYGMHSALKGSISKDSTTYISLQARAKQLDDWAALLEQQYGPGAWQQHCVSQQLLFDARALTHGVLALTDWLDAQRPGFELRCSKCNQNAVENSFSKKRASGSNTNPSAIEVARLISSERCANITSHLNRKSSYESADDQHDEASIEGSSELFMSQLAEKRQSQQVRLWQLDTLQPPDGAPAAEAQRCRRRLLAAAVQQQLQGHPVPAACLQALGWCSEAAPAPAAQEVAVLWESLCSAAAAAVEASTAKDAADGLLDEHSIAELDRLQQAAAQAAAAAATPTAEIQPQALAAAPPGMDAKAWGCVQHSLCIDGCWWVCYSMMYHLQRRTHIFTTKTLPALQRQQKRKAKKQQKLAAAQAAQADGTAPDTGAAAPEAQPGASWQRQLNEDAVARVAGWVVLKLSHFRQSKKQKALLGSLAEQAPLALPAELCDELRKHPGFSTLAAFMAEGRVPNALASVLPEEVQVPDSCMHTSIKEPVLPFFTLLQELINSKASVASIFSDRHAAYKQWLAHLEGSAELFAAWCSMWQALLGDEQLGGSEPGGLLAVLRQLQGMAVQRYMHAMQREILQLHELSASQPKSRPDQALRPKLLNRQPAAAARAAAAGATTAGATVAAGAGTAAAGAGGIGAGSPKDKRSAKRRRKGRVPASPQAALPQTTDAGTAAPAAATAKDGRSTAWTQCRGCNSNRGGVRCIQSMCSNCCKKAPAAQPCPLHSKSRKAADQAGKRSRAGNATGSVSPPTKR
jgi:hypothetical protein